MRANTITTMSRRMRQRRRRALALAAGVCALVVPATASAEPIGSTPFPDDTQATGGSYSSVNSIAPPTSEPSGSAASSAGSGYASLNSITGAPAAHLDARLELAEQLGRRVRLGERRGRCGGVAGARRARRCRAAQRAQAQHGHAVSLDRLTANAPSTWVMGTEDER